jgi:hypothetical protein
MAHNSRPMLMGLPTIVEISKYYLYRTFVAKKTGRKITKLLLHIMAVLSSMGYSNFDDIYTSLTNLS